MCQDLDLRHVAIAEETVLDLKRLDTLLALRSGL